MMRELIENSAFLGVVITIGSFELGRAIRKKWNFALFNPLLLAILFSIGVLLLFRIDYGSYLNGAKYINFLLTPVTVCLAVPLYEKFELLKKNALAITLGIAAGVAASLCHGVCARGALPAGLLSVHHASPQTHHYRDRHGRFRGAWRLPLTHGRGDHSDRPSRQYLR